MNFGSHLLRDPEGGNQHAPEYLQFLAQIPSHVLPFIDILRPSPSEFSFAKTDAILAGRTLRMNIWEVHNDEQQEAAHAPRPGSNLFVVEFPFKICDQQIVRYYSQAVSQKIQDFCHSVAQKYGVDIHCYGENLDMHPIHRLVECCFPCNQKPGHLILTIPESLSRHEYLVWTELFMREIYELLLDESYKSYGTTCWNLSYGILEHNASATGLFKAQALIRPITPYGRTFPDDFSVAEFRELPQMNEKHPKKMAVVVRASYRWMANRHTNARPLLIDRVREALRGGLRGTESDEDHEDSQDSESDSEVNHFLLCATESVAAVWQQSVQCTMSVAAMCTVHRFAAEIPLLQVIDDVDVVIETNRRYFFPSSPLMLLKLREFESRPWPSFEFTPGTPLVINALLNDI